MSLMLVFLLPTKNIELINITLQLKFKKKFQISIIFADEDGRGRVRQRSHHLSAPPSTTAAATARDHVRGWAGPH
jgi:hypothetical protein